MEYYFIRATSNFGPVNFPIYTLPSQSLEKKVNGEALIRGIIICSDWTSESITQSECSRLMQG